LFIKKWCLGHCLVLYLIWFFCFGRSFLLLTLYHAWSFELLLILILLSSTSFRSLWLLWLLLRAATIVHNTRHLRDSWNLGRWLVVVILINLLVLSYPPFSILTLLSYCPLLVLLSFSLALSQSVLMVDLHLLLHLLHHLLHAHGLPFVFSMNLLFNLLLNIHIFNCSLYWNHSLEVVYSFPEFFECLILYQFLTFVNIQHEWFQFKLEELFAIFIFVNKVTWDFRSK